MTVVLRPLRESDVPDYVGWMNDPEVMRFLPFEPGTATLEAEQEWFRRVSSPENGRPHWAIEVEGKHVGNCALHPDASGRQAVFGIFIGDKTMWDRGCGTAALKETLRIGFTELGLHRIYLRVFAENARARRCYEKCGLRQEGYHRQVVWKDGAWVDDITMAILKGEWEGQRDASERRMDEVAIRSYRAADHQQVCTLWEACDFRLGPSDRAEAIERKRRFGRGAFFVAEAQGAIVATAMGAVDGARAWVNRVAVHPDYRRRGLARRLLTELEEVLRRHGACYVNLLTHEENLAAQALYEGLGYQAHRQILYMSKALPEVQSSDLGSGG